MGYTPKIKRPSYEGIATVLNNENRFYAESGKTWLQPDKGVIFVFGSNLAGRHGKGAAKNAMRFYGAIYGRGTGLQRRSYAIPTKDENLEPMELRDIVPYIHEFVDFTRKSEFSFLVTPVGTGLRGLPDEAIAPHFKGAINCWFTRTWEPFLV